MSDEFTKVADLLSNSTVKLSNQDRLELYGLYKAATQGKCTIKSPPFYEMQAKAKYEAWKKVDGLSRLEAQTKYVEIGKQLLNVSDSNVSKSHQDHQTDGMESWIATSQMEKPKLDCTTTLFDLAKQGRISDIKEFKDIIVKDGQGMTIMHWAADRNQLKVVEEFLPLFDIDDQDCSGNTALHYAAMVENLEIINHLYMNGARIDVANAQGETASEFYDFETKI